MVTKAVPLERDLARALGALLVAHPQRRQEGAQICLYHEGLELAMQSSKRGQLTAEAAQWAGAENLVGEHRPPVWCRTSNVTCPGAILVLLPCCCKFLVSVRCSGLLSGLRTRPVLALLASLNAVLMSFGGEPAAVT